MPFLVVPLDARPVCYDFVLDLARIAGLSVLLPPKHILGQLKHPAQSEALQAWWRDSLQPGTVIVSLDTLAYGGLISSRVNIEPLEDLEARATSYLSQLQATHHPRYAFSSILRIPAYNNNQEEPDYWENYGAKLYEVSVYAHQHGLMPDELLDTLPDWVIQDFMARREKNFVLNQSWLNLLDNKQLDYLVYCQDDTGPHGLNVQEAGVLQSQIKNRHLSALAGVQTGADELALSLMARALWAKEKKPLKIFPWFFPEHGKQCVAKFDGVALGQVVERNIHNLGATISLSPWDADLILVVNAPYDQMGDHIPQDVSIRPKAPVDKLMATLKEWLPQKPIAIADVVYANGGDPVLLKMLLETSLPIHKLTGYAAWNTPGNSIGSALAVGAVSVWAQKNHCLNEMARKELLLKRFLDDGVYQADVRNRLRSHFGATCPESSDLNNAMADAASQWKSQLKLPDAAVHFEFPCQRTFEIEVRLG